MFTPSMSSAQRRILILGYGNVSREDDGIGFHVVAALARRLGRPPLDMNDDGLSDLGHPIDLAFVPQLTPELAETIANYDEVLFVDAHTGAFAEDIRWQTVTQGYEPSAFTHHLMPATLVELAEALHGHRPLAHLISVRGHRFGFGVELSPEAARLCEEAAEQIAAHVLPSSPATE